jgi:cysteine synthase
VGWVADLKSGKNEGVSKLIYRSLIEAELQPKLIQLSDSMVAASFFLMKLVPAEYILRLAAAEGLVQRDSVIVESTSGSFGYALAILSRQRGYRFVMVSDPVIDQHLRSRLEELGTLVEIVQTPVVPGGFQAARLKRVAELLKKHPRSYWPQQYENHLIPLAYANTAAHLIGALDSFDCLVGTVGTGSSMCGLAHALRESLPNLHVIGVDTHGSILFGQPDRPRTLRGLGNSIMPTVLDHTVFDDVHWVTAAEAFRATRELYSITAMFRGPTSGAAFLVADWWARTHPGSRTVVIFPDEGHRYDATVYADDWLRRNKLDLERLPDAPEAINHPGAYTHKWSCFHWNRCALSEVINRRP